LDPHTAGRFMAGDYASAIEASSRAQKRLGHANSLETADHHSMTLSRAAFYDSALPDERHQHSSSGRSPPQLEVGR